MNTVNNIHIKAARFVCKVKNSIPNDEVLKKCSWKSLIWYQKRRLACIAYQIYNDPDHPLKHPLKKTTNNRQLRNNYKLTMLTYKTVKYKQSFCYRAASIWYNIEDKLKENNYNTFKKEISE